MIELEKEICGDLKMSETREWIETNGIGGYSSGTVSGVNSRRYHGVLVAATEPPSGRMVLLARLEETLIIGDRRFMLYADRFPGVVDPTGFIYIDSFRLDTFPIWTFNVEGYWIEKTICMAYGENTAIIRWSLIERPDERAENVRLEVRPMLAFRDHHHLRTSHDGFDTDHVSEDKKLTFTPLQNGPQLTLAHNATVTPSGFWYENFEYSAERERGFDCHEDLYGPCILSFDDFEEAVVIASTEGREFKDAEGAIHREIERRAAILDKANTSDDISRQLVAAADQFIVKRGGGSTVIAGYHWFTDWGRDTMIALDGLTLATGRHEVARKIITEFAGHVSDGMLPNRFPDHGETADYNTVDATLWYFEAIRSYIIASRDGNLINEIYPVLTDIIEWHFRGTRHGIQVDDDGLLTAGDPTTQLTWMDAKSGGIAFTSRWGKAVEIQALWFNALNVIADMAEFRGDKPARDRYRLAAERAKTSFNDQFWNESKNCLYDVVNAEGKDDAVRPNQIFAISLTYPILEEIHWSAVIDTVEKELLTPYGLRSLSPRDPKYRGIYKGGPFERDSSYHQGTVWAWLIGHFADAYARVKGDGERTADEIKAMLAAFDSHLSEAMIGSISEIFDADPPFSPKGAAAQAWSVSEVLRVRRKYCRDRSSDDLRRKS